MYNARDANGRFMVGGGITGVAAPVPRYTTPVDIYGKLQKVFIF